MGQALELDVSQARALFMLLDVDETNEVELEEFIGGCMRMKGDAKSIDVNMLLYENEKMITIMANFVSFCEEKFASLEAAVGANPNNSTAGSRDISRVNSNSQSFGNDDSKGTQRSRAPSISPCELRKDSRSPSTSNGRLTKSLDLMAQLNSKTDRVSVRPAEEIE